MNDQARSELTEYPDDLVRAVGLVVLYASLAEDKAGELVQLQNTLKDEAGPVKGWADSGKGLVSALGKVATPELSERLGRALAFRNEVVHGIFLPGEHLAMWGEEPGPDWVTMKRRLGADAPAKFAFVPWTVQALYDLAQELASIERLLDEAVSDAMGIGAPSAPAAE